MLVNTHKTLLPYIFSQGKGQYVLGESLHSSETVGKHAFVGALWQKINFHPVNAGYLQS